MRLVHRAANVAATAVVVVVNCCVGNMLVMGIYRSGVADTCRYRVKGPNRGRAQKRDFVSFRSAVPWHLEFEAWALVAG